MRVRGKIRTEYATIIKTYDTVELFKADVIRLSKSGYTIVDYGYVLLRQEH